ncbi:MAG: thermonuclease family protein [Acidovorax sp.]|nr:thermonuclease family protein [Acidovorax sp.]
MAACTLVKAVGGIPALARPAQLLRLLALAGGIALCAPVQAQPYTFTGLVVGISDGDTLTVLTEQTCEGFKDCRSGKRQHRVRLAEIDAPESGQPYGGASRRMLSNLAFQKRVDVQQVDTDRYGRVIGQVFASGKWINGAMVAQGGAWVYRQYAKTATLLEMEHQARTRKIGLWGLQADQITPPWQWRRDKQAHRADSRTGKGHPQGSADPQVQAPGSGY